MTDPIYSPEAMLVAAVLDRPDEWDGIRWVSHEMITDPSTHDVYSAINRVMKTRPDTPSDELVVQVRNMLIENNRRGAVERLTQLIGAYPAIGILAGTYARAVHQAHQEQGLGLALIKTQQVIASRTLTVTEKASMIEQTWTDALADARTSDGWQPISGLSTVNDFISQTDETHDWVIPGLLERQERFMLIAPEKAGKSVLTRQVAMCVSSGRHPFSLSTLVPAMRSLIVDLENPAPVTRRDLRRQVGAMADLWRWENGDAWLLHRPAGIHLGDPDDRLMLRQVIERHHIDLVCISPIYKAYDGLAQSWEEQAFGVQKPLDRLREDFNCAIWLEHHAPWGEKGNDRSGPSAHPDGSGGWTIRRRSPRRPSIRRTTPCYGGRCAETNGRWHRDGSSVPPATPRGSPSGTTSTGSSCRCTKQPCEFGYPNEGATMKAKDVQPDDIVGIREHNHLVLLVEPSDNPDYVRVTVADHHPATRVIEFPAETDLPCYRPGEANLS